MKVRCFLVLSIFLVCALAAHAHVGSPDVYADGQAGPYRLAIVIRPPVVIPGVADIEVRSLTPGVRQIGIAPMPLTGEASKHPPVPDTMTQPSNDPQFFAGHLWIMATGSWQIRFAVAGDNGPGALAIPLPAVATATRRMQRGLGVLLSVLGIVLVLGMIGIVGAAAREAKLPPGDPVIEANYRFGRIAMVAAGVFLAASVYLGNVWWNAEAKAYSGYVYKPLRMQASLERGDRLTLKLIDPGWLTQRKLDDFIPDHDHLMHLYLIRWPQMDAVFHLHPEPAGSGEFQLELPPMPAGDYRLYADVVHATGFPETVVGSVELPALAGRKLEGDDAVAIAPPVPDSASSSNFVSERFALPDGYTMVWKSSGNMTPNQPLNLEFELLDRNGRPAPDVSLYMGMLGHAAVVKTDGTVFAHIHPNGTVAMAALMMANSQTPAPGNSPIDMAGMTGMRMNNEALPSTVRFPYGFPSPGRYRIFVQMKHGATVETGVFDANVPDGLHRL